MGCKPVKELDALFNQFSRINFEEISIAEGGQMIYSLLELFHGPAVIVDGYGIIEYCNNSMLCLPGAHSNLVGREFITICRPPESHSEINAILKAGAQNWGPEDNVLCKMVLSHESEYLINWKVGWLSPSSDGSGKAVFIGYNIGDHDNRDSFDPVVSPVAPPGIYIVQDGIFKFWNSHVSFFSGMDGGEMINCHYSKIVHPDDVESVRNSARDMLKGKRTELYEYRFVRKDGGIRWAMEAVVPVIYGGRRAALGYIIDITEKKDMEQNVVESKNIYRTIFENSGTAMIMYNEDLMITMANKEVEKLSGYKRSALPDGTIKWFDLVTKESLEKILYQHKLRMSNPLIGTNTYEFDMVTRDGTIKNILYTVSIVPGTGATKRLGSMVDITARKQAEDRLRFLGTHDKLTGLYNRQFFEEQLEAINNASHAKIGFIVCDIDGLKLINDAFGHAVGDDVLTKVGHILEQSSPKESIVARIGGDEFAILLPGDNYHRVDVVCSLIRQSIDSDNNNRSFQFPLSVSLGSVIAEINGSNPYELLKIADSNMYREKLLHGQSIRSNIVQIAKQALGERDFITEGHAERLRALVCKISNGYKKSNVTNYDLILLAEFHDIGKIGIPDYVLFKAGSLTDDEYRIMQRHCEIGERIALSSSDLAPIAGLILKHHERWDGNGYPLRLKGEDIPLACRILAIADSYDAMTSDRPYRKAMSHEDAVVEIKRCSGSQFDPEVVELFMRSL